MLVRFEDCFPCLPCYQIEAFNLARVLATIDFATHHKDEVPKNYRRVIESGLYHAWRLLFSLAAHIVDRHLVGRLVEIVLIASCHENQTPKLHSKGEKYSFSGQRAHFGRLELTIAEPADFVYFYGIFGASDELEKIKSDLQGPNIWDQSHVNWKSKDLGLITWSV